MSIWLAVSMVVLVILTLASLPNWSRHRFGYAPAGILGSIVLVLFLALLRQI